MRLVPTEERYPIQPLLDALGCTLTQVKQRYGVQLWEHLERGLTEMQADRVAIRCGIHPAMVDGWDWVERGLTVIDRRFVAEGWRQAWEWNEAAA